jgi:hypothetical protein
MYHQITTDDVLRTPSKRNEAWPYDALHPRERLHNPFCYVESK